MLKGIAASAGVAVAKVYKLETPKVVIEKKAGVAEEEVKKFILKHLSHGVTILDAKGGFTGQNQKVIMCIIPTKEYFIAKEGIHEIDSNAFFVVTDAYEVSGGA